MLRQHATHLEETGNVAAPAIGRHAKYNSIIKDEAVLQRILKKVREDSETKKGVKREVFQRFVERNLMSRSVEGQRALGSSVSSNWNTVRCEKDTIMMDTRDPTSYAIETRLFRY